MKNKNSIPAFTIMELTITMLISAIAIGLMYSAYAIISHSYLSFASRNESTGTIAMLDQRLKRDIDKAEIILRDSNTITMKGAKDTVVYRFRTERVIREKMHADTFKVSMESFVMTFESGPASESGGRVDDLRVVLAAEGRKIPYHYHKIYSSVNLFKLLN
ncbi:hypothetical protein [Mucilaginibacter kameinonensis]|uniref:hypothetical protein n=1 Tax=Mucilaginibacter kameinonensis TaxID=452286 RepID=UPI000EF77577|nr:hypothetical protein [Mucilaginibacter kameinonensis]